jgi:hypothetical protein
MVIITRFSPFSSIDSCRSQLFTGIDQQIASVGGNSYSFFMVNTQSMQLLEGFTCVGMEPALCSNVNNDFGVLCLGHKKVFCSTCKHSTNCKHLRQLQAAIAKGPPEDLSPTLKAFACCEMEN